MTFSIEKGDLSRLAADAVVVPANTRLDICGGAGEAVARAAGRWRLRRACKRLGGCAVGGAVSTPGFKLKARHIIHAVGPVWIDGSHGELELLGDAYASALELSDHLGAQSVALPLLSTGAHGFPVREAFEVAIDSVREFLDEHETDVALVLSDKAAIEAGELFSDVKAYLEREYHEEPVQASYAAGYAAPTGAGRGKLSESELLGKREVFAEKLSMREEAFEDAGFGAAPSAPSYSSAPMPPDMQSDSFASPAGELIHHSLSMPFFDEPADLCRLLDNLDEPFSTTLLALIDARGMTDAEVYKRANISRQHFSKIRSSAEYRPTKKTVLALAVALRLDLDETRDLLNRAGFALSHSSKFDVIIEYFIKNRCYDIFAINKVLWAFDQPLLG